MPPEDEQAAAPAVAVAVAPPPCGACRTLRRRCVPGCVFAPYFSIEDFAAVHRVFGASNASKMLEGIEVPEQRRVAAATLIEEAKARARDPSFGCISYLRILQEVNDKARTQVDEAREEIAREFGALAASEPVDVEAASPAARLEARAQVDAALKHAREQDARLLGVRKANEVRWRELHQQQQAGTGTGAGKHAGNWKQGPDVVKRHRGPSSSEQTLLMRRAAKQRQQMAVAEAEREKALLMRQAAPAKQHGHNNLGAQNGETTEPPRVHPEVYGHGQLHQQMSGTSREEEEAMRSVQPPAAAAPQHLDSAGAGQHAAGTGRPRHAGDDAAADRTQKRGRTSVLLEAMMQLAGARDPCGEQQQHLVAQHAQKDIDISREMQKVSELLELARNQQIMKNDVMTGMGQWDAAAGEAMTMTMTMTQQIPNGAWQHQHQYPAPQEMPQQMEEASTAELAQTTTWNMSQQFAWAQHYHDPAAVHRHASPWHHQMAEAHQPPAASAPQVASEQNMLLLLQQRQHQVAAAAELLSTGGARQFDNLAAQYDGTELTLGYGHPGMHQQVAAAGQVAGVQDMAAVLAERQMMQRLAAGAQQHAQTGLDLSNPDAETQALLQELAAILDRGGKQEMIRKQSQSVETGMGGQWDAAAGVAIAREQDVMTMTQQSPDDVWILQRSTMQAQELFAKAEMERKLEMLMMQFVAAGHARERELMIAQQAAAAAAQQQRHLVAQYSGTELDVSLGQGHGHGHPYWHQPTVQQMLQEKQLPTVQQMLQEQQLADAAGFLSPVSAKDAPFLADQQPQPNGHHMGSSLLPPSLSQLHAQASHQQRTDGGGQGLNSDLAAYLHYESSSRHGLAGNGKLQQG